MGARVLISEIWYQSDAVFASRTVSQPGERTHSLIPLREDFLCARGESVLAPFAFLIAKRGRQLWLPSVTSRAAQYPAREASGSARLVRPPVI
jgi:hypothetical protein